MVSTRSGRSSSAARDQEDVPAVPATRRTSRAKKVSDPIPEAEPAAEEPQYEDIPAAAAFQVGYCDLVTKSMRVDLHLNPAAKARGCGLQQG
jgi:hypothetical protein